MNQPQNKKRKIVLNSEKSKKKEEIIVIASGSAKTICFHLFTDEGWGGDVA